MNIIFAGTPAFAVTILEAILAAGHNVVAVYTQPDRPAGRGRHLHASAVKQFALENQLVVRQPETLRTESEQQQLAELKADVMVVVAYGLILPAAVLKIPRYGCINVHASLLPRWRGAAPIQHAILAGDTQTGITIMQMDAGLDTGPMLSQLRCEITDSDTSGDLHNKLATLGATAITKTLAELDSLSPIAQDNAQATYASKITKQQAQLDWQQSAEVLARQVRGLNPVPIAFTLLDDTVIRIWQALPHTTSHNHASGTIVDIKSDGIYVATNNSVLQLTTLQLPGGKPLSVREILNGKPKFFQIGQILK